MRHLLTQNAIGPLPVIDISDQEYAALKQADEILTNVLSMEEKYDLVTSNYLDFETELLNSAAYSMVKGEYTRIHFFNASTQLNKRMVNLLTASRMYRDQLSRHVAAAAPCDADVKNTVSQLFSRASVESFEYRFMEQMRNSVQHVGFPIHWIQFPMSWDAPDDPNLRFSTRIGADKIALSTDKRFKRSILEESTAEIDLVKTTRMYVEVISKIHFTARNLVEDSLLQARTSFENAISRYQTQNAGDAAGLTAVCLDDEECVIDKLLITLEWDSIRIQLANRNPLLANLSKRYVSSKILPK